MVSVGSVNKDGAMMEFLPASLAYQEVPWVGFRTFIKGTRKGKTWVHQPFFPEVKEWLGAMDWWTLLWLKLELHRLPGACLTGSNDIFSGIRAPPLALALSQGLQLKLLADCQNRLSCPLVRDFIESNVSCPRILQRNFGRSQNGRTGSISLVVFLSRATPVTTRDELRFLLPSPSSNVAQQYDHVLVGPNNIVH